MRERLAEQSCVTEVSIKMAARVSTQTIFFKEQTNNSVKMSGYVSFHEFFFRRYDKNKVLTELLHFVYGVKRIDFGIKVIMKNSICLKIEIAR
jgi:hypothetical protein